MKKTFAGARHQVMKLIRSAAFAILILHSSESFGQTHTFLWAADGNTTGALQNPLSLGNWSNNTAVPQYKFYTTEQGSVPLQIHSTRWAGGLTLTRDDPNGTTNMMTVGGWSGVGASLNLFNQSNQATILLNSNGTSLFRGGNVHVLSPTTSTNANLIVQGGGGNYQAFWLTAADGVFKIGGGGATEPASGAVNIDWQGKVVIGNTAVVPTPGNYKLYVENGIITERVKVAVKTTADWSDHVFKQAYRLMPINELEKFIAAKSHLPGILSAEEMIKEGNDLGKTDAKLLEKIEELTLYIIQLNKDKQDLQAQVDELKRKSNTEHVAATEAKLVEIQQAVLELKKQIDQQKN